MDTSDTMRHDATVFNKTANTAKGRMWWKNAKLMVVIVIIVLVIMAAIIIPVYIRSK